MCSLLRAERSFFSEWNRRFKGMGLLKEDNLEGIGAWALGSVMPRHAMILNEG